MIKLAIATISLPFLLAACPPSGTFVDTTSVSATKLYGGGPVCVASNNTSVVVPYSSTGCKYKYVRLFDGRTSHPFYRLCKTPDVQYAWQCS